MNAKELKVGTRVLVTEQDDNAITAQYYDTVTEVERYLGPNGPTLSVRLEKFGKSFPFTGIKVFYGEVWPGDGGLDLSKIKDVFVWPTTRKLPNHEYEQLNNGFNVNIKFNI